MNTILRPSLAVLAAICLSAVSLTAQENTISAKPGAVNYVEGSVLLNGKPLPSKGLRNIFLGANDVLSTDQGRAEVLLTPGVYLRVGENSEVRMVAASLIDTKVELMQGEAMIEATGLVKDNNLEVLDHGTVTTVKKNGLYRFTADNPPTVAVFDGKARVEMGDRKVDLKKGRETVLAANLKAKKFDRKRTDDLYAWSNVRSEYQAAVSYRMARSANAGTLGAMGYGFGPGRFSSGWYWDNGFSSWGWLPGSGAFSSPFGYGFYSPGLVGYAPVVISPLYGARGYGYRGGHRRLNPPSTTGSGVVSAPVPRRPGGWNGSHGGAGIGMGNAGGWRGGGGPGMGSHPSMNGGGRPSFGGGGGNGGGGRPGGFGGGGMARPQSGNPAAASPAGRRGR